MPPERTKKTFHIRKAGEKRNLPHRMLPAEEKAHGALRPQATPPGRAQCSAGLSNACTNYATTALSGTETAAFRFPAVSVGTILLSLLAARLLFGEKIRPRHPLAFLFGASTVFLLRFQGHAIDGGREFFRKNMRRAIDKGRKMCYTIREVREAAG